jgi:hypothetical protein
LRPTILAVDHPAIDRRTGRDERDHTIFEIFPKKFRKPEGILARRTGARNARWLTIQWWRCIVPSSTRSAEAGAIPARSRHCKARPPS